MKKDDLKKLKVGDEIVIKDIFTGEFTEASVVEVNNYFNGLEVVIGFYQGLFYYKKYLSKFVGDWVFKNLAIVPMDTLSCNYNDLEF